MAARRIITVLGCIVGLSWMNANAQWKNQAPDSLLRAYNNVFMLDGRTGWITGDYGSILKTGDGGASWTLQLSNSSWFNGVGQIAFVDSLTGFALGSNSWGQYLLRTTDGGSKWSLDSATFKTLIDSFYFPLTLSVTRSGDSSLVSLTFVAVLGPGVTNVEVYTSTDVGASWQQLNLPPIPNAQVAYVVYPSPSTVLVSTVSIDSMYRSTDLGKTWKAEEFFYPPYFYALTWRFFNADTGYFAGPTDPSISMETPLTIGWTYDGGLTWALDSNVALNGALVGKVWFQSRERGLATIWNKPSIFATEDGGTTWTATELANHIPPSDIGSADGRTVIADGAGGEILVSNDSGATWADLTPPAKLVFTSIKYASPHLVGAIGSDAAFYTSTDSAKTWTRHPMPSGLNVVFDFGDTLNLWIVDDSSRVYRSRDLGLSWKLQDSTLLPAPPLYAVDFLNDSVGCAAGSGGYIVTTADGGATWNSQTISSVDSLYGVCIVTPEEAWTVGGIGTILHSDDGLKTWTRETSPTTVALRSVMFSDTLNGYILGDYGLILNTTDGGETWSIAQSPGTGLNAMKFVDADTGWVVGDNGQIYYTVDGGAAWTPQSSGVASTLKSVDFANNNYGAIVGDGGIVLTTNNGGRITGIVGHGPAIPTTPSLSQNYPNPFNPTTIINYRLSAVGQVSLKVYDVLGREVETLVNDRESAGVHSVTFNAAGLASGVYFYRISTQDYVSTLKMLLLK